MKFYVSKQQLSHAVKQGMNSDLVRDLNFEVFKERLNHGESVSFEWQYIVHEAPVVISYITYVVYAMHNFDVSKSP